MDDISNLLKRDEEETLSIRAMELEAREAKVVKQIAQDKDDNAIFYFHTPNPPQEDLLYNWLDDYLKVFTFTGGNRSGKTTIGVILSFCVTFGFFPWNRNKLKFPHRRPRKTRIVGQDWEKHIGQVVVPAMNKWWPSKREVIKKKNNTGVEYLWTDVETGSTIEIMSNGQDSKLHEGWDGDLVYYDEPPKRDIRIANTRGLVDRNGRELFAMTLLNEAWVDKEVIKAMNPDGTPNQRIYNVHAEIYDNIGFGLTAEAVEIFAEKLKDDERDSRLKGVPSYKAGLILPQFNRKTHLKTYKTDGKGNLVLPLDWIIDIAIDFHPSKPWDILFVATSSNGFKHVIFEISKNASWKVIGEDIIRYLKKWGCRVNNIVIDPLAKGDPNSDLKEESVFDKLYDLFAPYNYRLATATKDKEGGIAMIEDLLWTENELAALLFSDKLRKTISQVEGWMYDDKGKPLKEDDDMPENLYRIILQDTEYTELENEDSESYKDSLPEIDSPTGY